MPSPELSYDLPCSGVWRCLDRFSILPNGEDIEDDNGEVPVWDIIKELLTTTSVRNGKQLTELLETIAITLKGSTGPAGDFGLLREVIDGEYASFLQNYWTEIVGIALSMPSLFPSSTLSVLGKFETQSVPDISESCVSLSRAQVACLVVHQFLCTLGVPEPRRTDYYDFSIWYNSQQRHEDAARIYLGTLLKYFGKVADKTRQEDELEVAEHSTGLVTFTLRRLPAPPTSAPETTKKNKFSIDDNSASKPLCTMQICQVGQYDTSAPSLGVPHGAAVVSANRVIGFGESATQEEIHVGCSPEACPAVLIVPELGDEETLVVRGAEAISNIVGQRRGIRLGSQEAVTEVGYWDCRTMLFMDALELDDPGQYQAGSDLGTRLPDLVPRNMEREILKAQLAFSSGTYDVIVSPLWGCGAFGGDPFIKTLLLWCAASLAQDKPTGGTHMGRSKDKEPFILKIGCDDSLGDVTTALSEVVHLAQSKLGTVGAILDLLSTIPEDAKRLETGSWLVQRLQVL